MKGPGGLSFCRFLERPTWRFNDDVKIPVNAAGGYEILTQALAVSRSLALRRHSGGWGFSVGTVKGDACLKTWSVQPDSVGKLPAQHSCRRRPGDEPLCELLRHVCLVRWRKRQQVSRIENRRRLEALFSYTNMFTQTRNRTWAGSTPTELYHSCI